MNAVQFFTFKADSIARKCIVVIDHRMISIIGVWTPARLDYRAQSDTELVTIVRALALAGAVIKARVDA